MVAALAIVTTASFNLALATGVAVASFLGSCLPPNIIHSNDSLAAACSSKSYPNHLITRYSTRVAKATKLASKEQDHINKFNMFGGFW